MEDEQIVPENHSGKMKEYLNVTPVKLIRLGDMNDPPP